MDMTPLLIIFIANKDLVYDYLKYIL